MSNDWVKPGAKVVVVRTHNGKTDSYKERTVARVGKRDIVLDDDTRFRLQTLRAPRQDYYAYDSFLVQPGTEEAKHHHREARLSVAESKARVAADQFLRRKKSPEEVIQAMEALVLARRAMGT